MHIIDPLLSLSDDHSIRLLHVKIRIKHVDANKVIRHVSWTAIECFCTIPISRFNVFFIFTRARSTSNDAVEGYRLALVFFMFFVDIFLVNRRKLTRFPLMYPLRFLLNDFLCHYFCSLARL